MTYLLETNTWLRLFTAPDENFYPSPRRSPIAPTPWHSSTLNQRSPIATPPISSSPPPPWRTSSPSLPPTKSSSVQERSKPFPPDDTQRNQEDDGVDGVDGKIEITTSANKATGFFFKVQLKGIEEASCNSDHSHSTSSPAKHLKDLSPHPK